MTDLSITAANVVPGATCRTVQGTAAETITAGQPVYLNAAGKWAKADSDAAGLQDASGIALTGSALNQPIVVAKVGAVTIGATLVAGDPYYVSSTAGGICPFADLSNGEKVVQLGVATSTTVLNIDIQNTGAVSIVGA